MRTKRWPSLGALGLGLASLSHCLAPTEIVVWLSTDVACSDVEANGVEITVGSSSYASSGCAGDGGLGSLVIVPSGGLDDRVDISVVLGVEAGVDACSVANQYAGCVVARRSLLYSPHTPLTLPIDLESSCLGVPCMPGTTCVGRTCVDAGVVCTDGQCDLPDAAPPDAAPPDAGTCFQPVPVSATGAAAQATPRITKVGSTYTIVWLASSGNIETRSVLISGGTTMVLPESTFLHPTVPITALGPLGTDGTTTYGLSFMDTGTAYLAYAPLDGGAPTSYGFGGAIAGLEGMFWESSGTVYAAASGDKGAGNVLMFEIGPVAKTVIPYAVALAPPKDVSLAATGTTYFVGFFDGACELYTSLWNGAAFTTFKAVTDPTVPSPCVTLKVATTATWQLAAYMDKTPTMYFIRTGETVGTPVQTLHDTNAFVPFTVSGAIDLLYLDEHSVMNVVSLHATQGPYALSTLVPITSFGGLPFDAVADDPTSSTGYAIAYWDNGTVYFGHSCP